MKRNWKIKPLSTVCAITGRKFQAGDMVECCIFKNEEGEMIRRDILAGSEELFELKDILGRWSLLVPNRNQTEKADSHSSALEFFRSLFDCDSDLMDNDRKELQFYLAILLERNRKIYCVSKSNEHRTYQVKGEDELFEVNVLAIEEERLLAYADLLFELNHEGTSGN